MNLYCMVGLAWLYIKEMPCESCPPPALLHKKHKTDCTAVGDPGFLSPPPPPPRPLKKLIGGGGGGRGVGACKA